jgi:large subunit ribosomal protein L21
MYAVIKTGGKQYRVQPGDVLVVEKLEGDVGAEIAFDQVLMLGDDGATHLGAPLLDGAVVRATLIETRKGDKVTTIKKIRRQGYRRTKGHRQMESVLRVMGLEGAGLTAKWDGEVSMMTRADMRLRARNLAPRVDADAEAPKVAKSTKKAAAPKVSAEKVVDANIVDEQAAAETKAPVKTEAKAKAAPAPKAESKAEAAPVKAKAAPAPKAEAKTETKPAAKAKAEPKAEAKPAAKAKTPAKAAAADGETKKAPAKKPAAKAAPKSKS